MNYRIRRLRRNPLASGRVTARHLDAALISPPGAMIPTPLAFVHGDRINVARSGRHQESYPFSDCFSFRVVTRSGPGPLHSRRDGSFQALPAVGLTVFDVELMDGRGFDRMLVVEDALVAGMSPRGAIQWIDEHTILSYRLPGPIASSVSYRFRGGRWTESGHNLPMWGGAR